MNFKIYLFSVIRTGVRSCRRVKNSGCFIILFRMGYNSTFVLYIVHPTDYTDCLSPFTGWATEAYS